MSICCNRDRIWEGSGLGQVMCGIFADSMCAIEESSGGVHAGPHLHQEARLCPGAAERRLRFQSAAILVIRHCAIICVRRVKQVAGFEEDGSIEIGVEAVMLCGETAVVEPDGLLCG